MSRGIAVDLLSAKAFAGVAAITSASIFTPEFTLGYLGVPFNVLVACILGTYSGFGFGDKVEPRSKVVHLFVACVIMGCFWTALAEHAIQYCFEVELKRGVLAGLGGVISCMARFFIPEMIKRIGPWLDKIPVIGKKAGE